MIIEIKGAQRVNQGASLMLSTVLARLHGVVPSARFAMAPGPFLDASDRKTVGAMCRIPLRKGRLDLNGLSFLLPAFVHDRFIKRELVLESRVDAVLDISGYVYGDRWGENPLYATAGEIRRGRAGSQRYLFLPQTFGPFRITRRAAERFGGALHGAAFVSVRDKESERAVRSISHPNFPVHRVPDITIGYPGDASAAKEWGVDKRHALLIPNVRLLDSSTDKLSCQTDYLTTLIECARLAKEFGLEPVILNHAGREDYDLCHDLADLADRSRLQMRIIQDNDPVRTKGIVGAAGFVVSSRYHGCVNALSQGVPCVATSWAHKYQELFADFGLDYGVIEGGGLESALLVMRSCLEKSAFISRKLASLVPEISSRVDSMWEDVFSILRDLE